MWPARQLVCLLHLRGYVSVTTLHAPEGIGAPTLRLLDPLWALCLRDSLPIGDARYLYVSPCGSYPKSCAGNAGCIYGPHLELGPLLANRTLSHVDRLALEAREEEQNTILTLWAAKRHKARVEFVRLCMEECYNRRERWTLRQRLHPLATQQIARGDNLQQ
jgi:hypothetical protein